MNVVQRVKRYVQGKFIEYTEVTHDKMRVTVPLTTEARRANYVKQNNGRSLTVPQLRKLRQMDRRS